MIRYVGYACVNENLKPKAYKTCRLKTALENEGVIKKLTLYNLEFLNEILQWNIKHDIYFYRMPSGIVPLSTHEDVLASDSWRWYEDKEILDKASEIKGLVADNDIRLSNHPDQFTVINSKNDAVVKKSIDFLEDQTLLLKLLGGSDVIIHVGGVYGDKYLSMERFINHIRYLKQDLLSYIRIENDDKSYTIEDVLRISKRTEIPVVFDYHHHRCLSDIAISPLCINEVLDSWKKSNQIPKIHISSGKNSVKDRKHADYINDEDIIAICKLFKDSRIDVMVEAKQKEKAALEVMAYMRKEKLL